MLLDTTILIDAIRRDSAIRDRLRDHGGPFFASAISADELLVGVLAGEEESTAALIDGLDVLPVGREEAKLASSWRRQFRARGMTLEQPDCLIAATAVLAGLPLATANVKDFPMPELHVEHWPSE